MQKYFLCILFHLEVRQQVSNVTSFCKRGIVGNLLSKGGLVVNAWYNISI